MDSKSRGVFTPPSVPSSPPRLLAALVAFAAAGCGGGASEPGGATALETDSRRFAMAAVADLRSDGTEYVLSNACSGKALDIQGNGDLAQLWERHDGPNQRWKLSRGFDGNYSLTATHSGKALDAAGQTNGAQILQWAPNGGLNQRWKITDVGNDFFKLVAAHAPTHALDVSGGGTANGTAVQLWTDNGSCAQQWKFTAVGGSDTPNSVEAVIYDSTGNHDDVAKGLPSYYDWAQHGRVSYDWWPDWTRALIGWGQIYEGQSNQSVNTRVEIKDFEVWVLSKQGVWSQMQSTTAVDGAAYRADFQGDVNKPADIRTESDGGVSVKADAEYNFHFWPTSGRASVDPANVAGVFSTYRTRLVMDNPNGPDDRARASYIAGVGLDAWRSLDAPWLSDYSNNSDVGISRMKKVGIFWQSVNMSNLRPEVLRSNPPPFTY